MSDQETWVRIPLAPNYSVSNKGRVKSHTAWHGVPGPRVLRSANSHGYRVVRILHDGKWKVRRIHQLVLEGFVGPRPEGCPEIRHLNGDRADNRLSNLAYGTRSENQLDRVEHGRHHHANKHECSRGHSFSDPENVALNARGWRTCRPCARAANRRYKERLKATRQLRAA